MPDSYTHLGLKAASWLHTALLFTQLHLSMTHAVCLDSTCLIIHPASIIYDSCCESLYYISRTSCSGTLYSCIRLHLDSNPRSLSSLPLNHCPLLFAGTLWTKEWPPLITFEPTAFPWHTSCTWDLSRSWHYWSTLGQEGTQGCPVNKEAERHQLSADWGARICLYAEPWVRWWVWRGQHWAQDWGWCHEHACKHWHMLRLGSVPV